MRQQQAVNVTQGPLLEALSSYRYVAHSFAVILSLVAAEQAARAGVVFADTLWFKGGSPESCDACDLRQVQSLVTEYSDACISP